MAAWARFGDGQPAASHFYEGSRGQHRACAGSRGSRTAGPERRPHERAGGIPVRSDPGSLMLGDDPQPDVARRGRARCPLARTFRGMTVPATPY